MKQLFTIVFVFFLGAINCFAQDEGFYLELKSDTILAGNVLEVTFIANNVNGQFEAPNLGEMNIVSGPNTSTSMSMVNGTVSQYASYSYGILLEDIGEVVIPPAYFETAEGTLETEPTSVLILPNPEGIIEQPPSQSGLFKFDFPKNSTRQEDTKKNRATKKKRKLKKI